MTEANDPKTVVRIMNSYFEEMAVAIRQHGGLVLQFLGDEIYAVFGAPVARRDHPARALRAGLEMNRRLIGLNERLADQGLPNLRHGIGIHTGQALAANIGSPDRLSYLLVGDTINVASRLQSLTKEVGTELIMSAETRTHLTDADLKDCQWKRLPSTPIKGKSRLVEIYAMA
jgi:class 3 adenylate cyclase